jgi:hypothetical protein
MYSARNNYTAAHAIQGIDIKIDKGRNTAKIVCLRKIKKREYPNPKVFKSLASAHR